MNFANKQLVERVFKRSLKGADAYCSILCPTLFSEFPNNHHFRTCYEHNSRGNSQHDLCENRIYFRKKEADRKSLNEGGSKK